MAFTVRQTGANPLMCVWYTCVRWRIGGISWWTCKFYYINLLSVVARRAPQEIELDRPAWIMYMYQEPHWVVLLQGHGCWILPSLLVTSTAFLLSKRRCLAGEANVYGLNCEMNNKNNGSGSYPLPSPCRLVLLLYFEQLLARENRY